MFGVSIFSSPQHFLALYLGLFLNPQKSVQQLNNILSRLKNPPISALHTVDILKSTSPENQSLQLIRFLSQLSDISEGTSMSTSLKGTISQSSFLTEVRHSLTHKVKVNDDVVGVARKIIKAELKQKYWDQLKEKVVNGYWVSKQKVINEYTRIYGDDLTQDIKQQINKLQKNITSEWLTKESSNYEFKQMFPKFLEQNPEFQILSLLQHLPRHKKSMAISHMVTKFCHENRSQALCQILVKSLKKESEVIYSQALVKRSLRKLTFLHYIGYCSKVIQILPHKILDQLANYWENKEKVLNKGQCGGKGKIYNRFRKELYQGV